MAETETPYRRLPGKGRKSGFLSATSRVTLWLGQDHILQVETTGWEEEYKRFYFRDIQAIVVRRTARDRIWSGALGGMTFICLLGYFTAGGGLAITCAVVGIITLIGFLINYYLGPTCSCQLRTAVQNEFLWSLNRMVNAERVLKTIVPIIEHTQGQLTAEALPQIVATLPQVAAPASALSKETQLGHVTHYHGRWHEALFVSLLMYGVFNFVDLMYDDPVLQIFDMLFAGAAFVAVIGSMMKQNHTDIPPGIKRVVWVTLAYYCLFIYAVMIGGAMFAVRRGEREPDLSDYGQFMLLTPVDVITIICLLPLGLIGMIQLTQFRNNYKPPTPAPKIQPVIQPAPAVAPAPAPVDPAHAAPAADAAVLPSTREKEHGHGESGPATLR
jgi:hypothetical protein